jgi:biopolymer transport protein ExbB/TolQ
VSLIQWLGIVGSVGGLLGLFSVGTVIGIDTALIVLLDSMLLLAVGRMLTRPPG